MNPAIATFPPCQVFYYLAMQKCTFSALHSMETMDKIRLQYDDQLPQPDVMLAFLNQFQNIIHQAGSLSRYFWPSRKEHRSRGEFLRNKFAMKDDDPLNNRELRNALEHFDERLDDFVLGKNAGEFVPDYFGRKLDDKQGTRHFMRSYFVDTDEFTVLGEVFAVQPIVMSIGSVNQRLTAILQGG